MAVADDITRLTAILVRQVQGGHAALLRQQRGLSASSIGKAAGCTAEQIYSWESGTSMPTTQQALAWLTSLHEMAPSSIVAMNRSAAADAKRAMIEQDGRTAEQPVDW